jgi:FlaA1/EpsC-like NDP-sugar epimerase
MTTKVSKRGVLKFKLLLSGFDTSLICATLLCYYVLKVHPKASLSSFSIYAAGILLIWLLTLYLSGGYDYNRIFRLSHNFRLISLSCIFASIFSQLFAWLFPTTYYALVLHYTTLIFIVVFYLLRLGITKWLIDKIPGKKLLIYGADDGPCPQFSITNNLRLLHNHDVIFLQKFG